MTPRHGAALNGLRLSDDERASLRRFVTHHASRHASSRALGVSWSTLEDALVGIGQQARTLERIRAALAAWEAAAVAASQR
jgi:hypothetical protein